MKGKSERLRKERMEWMESKKGESEKEGEKEGRVGERKDDV